MAIYRFSYTLVLFLILQQAVTSLCKTDADILLQFKKSLGNSTALSNWDPSVPPCNNDDENWAGVLCEVGLIWGLKLENMGLIGDIDLDSLSELKTLRTISLMNNNFEGPLPDIKKLGALKTIYLSNNKFSGEIPSNAFEGMLSIKKIHLANNEFTGLIPGSLTKLTKLIELMLQNNQFEGEIPELKQKFLMLNLSNNQLQGPIPDSLSSFKESAFSGNKDLCGAPLKECDPSLTPSLPEPESSSPSSSSPSSPSSPSPKLSLTTLIVVVVASTIAVASLIAVVFILRRPKQNPENQGHHQSPRDHQTPTNGSSPNHVAAASNLDKMERGLTPERSPEPNNNKKTDQSVKLTFLQENRQKFDMTDLLKASAEILGSGVFGSSYKAALNIGPVVVVKRYRQMNNVSKEEFHEHMRRLGQLNHPNLLPLVAFYYRKEEKLLIADHVNNVSLAVHLHGSKSCGQPSPDWPTRLKIVKGVARGLLYLYNSLPSLIAPHGHLKSSNVLLTANFEPLLTDYALLPVVNSEHAQEQMIAYKSPEFKQNRRITKKTDIWSLGILILEILTGKFPSNFLQQGQGGSDTDLAAWVNTVLKEGDASSAMEVFDKDMRGTKNSEGEMMKLLKIALWCCQDEIDKRLDIREAMEKIEEVKEKDNNNNNNINNIIDDEFYSTRGSEADLHSSRGLSNDFDHIEI